MRINIEMADNGIIIRNPDCEDEVTLVVTCRDSIVQFRTNEYNAIGKNVYDWLMDEVYLNCEADLIITNFDLEITATCKGRPL